MIISGGEDKAGSSAEVFIPSTGKNCRLPDMPGSSRAFHTMEKMMICGGDKTKKSCLTLIDGIWKETTTLLVDRYNLTVFHRRMNKFVKRILSWYCHIIINGSIWKMQKIFSETPKLSKCKFFWNLQNKKPTYKNKLTYTRR